MAAPDALALAGRVLHDAQPAAGGYSGETFAGLWFRQRAYVRLYLRDPARAQVDLAIMRRLEGTLPLPKVLGAVTDVPASGSALPAHIITAAVPGQRGDTLLESGASVPAARALGRQSARVIGVLRQQLFEAPGPFVNARLDVGEWPPALATLASWAQHLRPGLLAAGLDLRENSPLLAALRAADTRLAGAAPQRPCLVHGDLNGKNMIVDPNTGRLRALIDWEFAHAGNWLADVGNLVRPSTSAPSPSAVAFRDGLVDAMHEGLHAQRPAARDVPPDWVRGAGDHDLFAVLELAAREVTGREATPPVAAARDLLRRFDRQA